MLYSILKKIEYYQKILDEIKYPILNPISYYKTDEEYRNNIKFDIMNYKNYENTFEKNIIELKNLCDEEGIELFRTDERTLNLKIRYVNIEKQKNFVEDLSESLLQNFTKFKI